MVSLDDPKIKDGAKFLCFMAFKWRGRLCLKPNLERLWEIRKKRMESQRIIVLAADLRRRTPVLNNGLLSDDTLVSWFRQSVVDEGMELITIWVENEFVRSRILADYLPVMQVGSLKEIRVCIGLNEQENSSRKTVKTGNTSVF